VLQGAEWEQAENAKRGRVLTIEVRNLQGALKAREKKEA
jgi:hypothetical protein